MLPLKNIGSKIWCLARYGTYIPIGFYVFGEKKAVYMPIPKTACTSIKLSTMANLIKSHQHDEYMNIHSIAEGHYHMRLNSQEKKYYKFAFVRNPFDRLVSCYEDKVKTPMQHNGRYFFDSPYNKLVKMLFGSNFSENMSFAEFIQLVAKIPDFLSDAHFRSQYSILYSKRNRLIPDYVGKFETLSEDWKPLSSRFDFPPLSLSNRSTRSNVLHYFNSPELLQIVASRYKNDIDYFDYSERFNDLQRQIF